MKKRPAIMRHPIFYAILLCYGLGIIFLVGCQQKALTLHEPPPPYPPIPLSASPVSDSRNDLEWKTVPGAASYRIYRNDIYLTSSVMPSLIDRKLKAATQYCYHVTAVDAAGKESERSIQACARTVPRAKPPLPAPEEIIGVAGSETQNNVSWKELGGAVSYKIYRDGLYLTATTKSSLSDGGLKADTQYCYAVSAVDNDGRESEIGKQICVTTLSAQKRAAEAAAAMFEKGRITIDIEFDYNQAVIKSFYHKEIKRLADVMLAHPGLQVAIEGHTDNAGSKSYNMKMSLKRAESVRKYLIQHFGIKASRLTAKGYGMSKPIASNKTAEGRKKNRRVEAIALYSSNKP